VSGDSSVVIPITSCWLNYMELDGLDEDVKCNCTSVISISWPLICRNILIT
jgi:hypothetical protein